MASIGFALFLTLVLSLFLDKIDSQIEMGPKWRLTFPKDNRVSISPRIVGGKTATPHAYPYQALLYVYADGGYIMCSGSLISTRWVLTAAHCLERASYALVHLGVHNMSDNESTQIQYNSSEFVVHERWSETELLNDIALVYLPTEVTLDSNVEVIRTARGNETYENEIARVTGWGLNAYGALSSVLKYVDVVVISNEQCKEYDLFRDVLVDSHICTSGSGSVGTCNGDSGGPLVLNGVQIGIVSFGYSDCASGKPSVYTRLTEFADWIETYAGVPGNSSAGVTGRLCHFLIVPVLVLMFN